MKNIVQLILLLGTLLAFIETATAREQAIIDKITGISPTETKSTAATFKIKENAPCTTAAVNTLDSCILDTVNYMKKDNTVVITSPIGYAKSCEVDKCKCFSGKSLGEDPLCVSEGSVEIGSPCISMGECKGDKAVCIPDPKSIFKSCQNSAITWASNFLIVAVAAAVLIIFINN